ncbi:MAG TPA: NTP transferase domain-containing protein [Gemmatimonadaceae bacterium]|nr:NTP transferase domain-containing protein [Gemmatimonadaceae bacterium]
MSDLALVMPMAGRGARFRRAGRLVPKPLIDLEGRPLFWWAAQSVCRAATVREIVFVVLEEHVEELGIDVEIRRHFPRATVRVISEVTAGAAETAAIGAAALASAGPVAVNDCDHAFIGTSLAPLTDRLGGQVSGALVAFRSSNPAYSYVRLNEAGQVAGTVEKQVVSPFAIAGCYLFADPKQLLDRMPQYRQACRYGELFVSGLYDLMIADGCEIPFVELAHHVSFGTPEELDALADADRRLLARLAE